MKHAFPQRRHPPYVESLEPRRLLAANDIVISEIMYHQLGDNTDHEFIELFNPGSQDIDVTHWRFDAGVAFTLPDISVPAKGYLVVAADVDAFTDLYPEVTNVVGGWSGRLANRGEGVTLVDAAGQLVDRVRYGDEGDWATRLLGDPDEGHRGWRWDAPHDGEGKSLELRNPVLSNDYGHNWGPSVPMGGTPGAPNSLQSSDIEPMIFALSHAPAIPTSSDEVTISVHVLDEVPSGLTVTLHYRDELVPTFQAKEMTGQDNAFRASLPAMADRTIVEYYVSAVDATGNIRHAPSFASDDASRTANRLYQVLDDAPSVDNWQPDAQAVTYLIMRSSEQLELADIGDGPFAEAESNAQMNGTYIRVDGNGIDVRYNVGIRNRGGASRVGPPNNYRINFPHDEPLDGATTLNINALFTHVEAIGNAIYRLAGLPAPEAIPIQTRVNGNDLSDPAGRMFGSYLETENITGSFPDRYFPDDNRGNLYRVVEANREFGALGYAGNDPAAYQENFSKRTNEEDADWSDIIDLLNVLNNATEEDFVSEVQRVIDVDQWLRYLALDSLLGNSETGLNAGRADKFWLYRGTIDTRFKLIPHDLDTILDIGRTAQPNRSVFSDYVEVEGLRRFLTHNEFVPRYYQAFVDLIDDVFHPETLFPLMDRLVGYVPDFELDNMKQFVIDRIQGVRDQLPLEFVVSTNLPTVDGYARTTLPAAELVGIANALTSQSILVNGQLADWSRATREWSLPISGDGTTQTLVPQGGLWRYYDQGAQSSDAWQSSLFNDSSWKSGPAPLGYGEGDEATVVSFGSSPFNKHITTYFRHQFEVSNAAEVLDLTMRLVRDDGIIVYLNGQEVVRSNMPAGDVDAGTLASNWIGGAAEGQQLSFAIDPTLLVDGTNTLSVEVHQVDSVDSDLRFDLSLEASVGTLSGGVPLYPGINRVHVAAYDQQLGQGNQIDQGYIDVWYDGSRGIDELTCSSLTDWGTPAEPVMDATTVQQDIVFAPCGPAYRITGEVTIPAGVTMTVLPGTTLFFEENAGLSIDGGKLSALGTEFASIRFTKAPNVPSSWNGIQFLNSTEDNRISHAVIEHATTAEGMIGLRSSQLEIDSTTFDHSDLFRILTIDSSLVIRDSVFTDMFAPGEPPLTDNGSEHIKGSGILDGGQLVLSGNYFGTTTGHNDSVDFDGAELPGPIPQIIGNYFAGSGDDALDLEADSLIVDNTFTNVRKDAFNNSTGDANAISAGDGRTYYAYRNRFHNVDHAVQVKDDAFLYFDHNSVDTVHISPIYFDLPDRTPGRGTSISNSIFTNTDVTLGAADQAQILEVNNSIVTADAQAFGEGNRLQDPKLADPATGDFSLLAGSPAKSQAFAGQDLGSEVPRGTWISGQPASTTGRRSAELAVGGVGVHEYRYRLDGGAWSAVRPRDTPILLTELDDGAHTVDVEGRDITGAATEITTASWTVDTSPVHIYLSEILASNDSIEFRGGTPDLIELYNDSDRDVDLAGMSISDRMGDPRKYVFPAGTSIAAGSYLVVEASDEQLGFRLDADGEGVFLFDTAANGGNLVDAVEFGIQITDLSISRIGTQREWKLSTPTFGTANTAIPTGRTDELRINEWLASGEYRFTGDFWELYNRDDVPVELSGLYLTDDPIARPSRHRIAPLSFIAAQGFVTFLPNGDVEDGANELEFGISKDGELLALLDPELRPIDQVLLFDQTTDVSQGRVPDGSPSIQATAVGTPGNPNPTFVTTVTPIVDFGDTWRFDQSGRDLGTAWRDESFDDRDWSSGAGPLGVVAGELPIAIQTPLDPPLDLGVVTHYFRREFQIDPALLENANTVFQLSQIVDDGAIIYINGVEVMRRGLPDGEVTSTTTANIGIGLPEIEGPFVIPSEFLRAGTNQLAVEVHQVSPRNSDVAFGLEMNAVSTATSDFYEHVIALQAGLRISEIMYHPNGNDAAEFLEFTNIQNEPLDLSGVSINGDVNVTIGEQTLAPGEYAVVVADIDPFRQVYGNASRVIGVYDGRLSNGGGEIVLQLPAPLHGDLDAAVLRFSYDDGWYPSTDGLGASLQIRNASDTIRRWDEAAGWRASNTVGGTPGYGEDGLLGDFNNDHVVDGKDVDLISTALATNTTDLQFDLNGDRVVDGADLDLLVEDILKTKAGDANLDGVVDFADFLLLSSQFGSQDATWSHGDFDANGEVDLSDFLLLSANFGFRRE